MFLDIDSIVQQFRITLGITVMVEEYWYHDLDVKLKNTLERTNIVFSRRV